MNGHRANGLASGTYAATLAQPSFPANAARSPSLHRCSTSEIQPASDDGSWQGTAKGEGHGGIGALSKWAATAGVSREAAALAINSPWLDLTHPMTPYEWLKLVAMTPMILIRLCITIVALPLVYLYVCCIVAHCPVNQPLAPWRQTLVMSVLRFWAGILIRIGFNIWPKYKGLEHLKEAERARAIVIFNHVSYTDPVILVELMPPCGLAKLGVARIPFFGTFARSLQFLFVDRKARGNGNENGGQLESATTAMHERAADARYPLFAIAPEGTTKAADCLLTFSTGAFVGGRPVLPVLFKYKAKYFSVGWGRVQSTLWHFLRLQSQFNNYLEVEILPVYYPSEEEKQSPRLYADNVRKLMAERLRLPLSPQGLPQWLMLKHEGICTDWKGSRIIVDRPPVALMDSDFLRKEQ